MRVFIPKSICRGSLRSAVMTYNIQERMHMEGLFTIKVTPYGVNLCLLEEVEEGEIKALVEEARGWFEQWFDETKEWTQDVVYNERLTWVRCYNVPCHAWSLEFFEFIISRTVKYICSDDETLKQTRMDVARILVRTKFSTILNEAFMWISMTKCSWSGWWKMTMAQKES